MLCWSSRCKEVDTFKVIGLFKIGSIFQILAKNMSCHSWETSCLESKSNLRQVIICSEASQMKSLASKYHRLLVYLRTNLQEFLFSQNKVLTILTRFMFLFCFRLCTDDVTHWQRQVSGVWFKFTKRCFQCRMDKKVCAAHVLVVTYLLFSLFYSKSINY